MNVCYPWLKSVYYQIIKQYQYGYNHNALLIKVMPGIGENVLIWNISCWLMCQKPKYFENCGNCYSCQLMCANTHPDWHSLKIEKSKPLDIEKVRNLIEKINTYPIQLGIKIVYLPNIGYWSEAAVCTLLKTIEDSPTNTYFFLTHTEQRFSSLILQSRCIKIYIPPPNEKESHDWLTTRIPQKNQELIIIALRLTGGSPLLALSLLNDKKYWQTRKILFDTMYNALQKDILLLLPILNNEQILQRINVIISLLLDAIKYHYKATKNFVNSDQINIINLITKHFSANCLLESASLWMKTYHRLIQVPTVNRELLIVDQLLTWERILHNNLIE
ncbi:DNA polymerase III subunit delta' C-terminal domain-containing protein [Candidatus Ishikawella capsulata]|nr:DNA polymerase III subunit delta' C-terminal domain-containing protein [Candidatus Ishikawaella capsulata]